MEGKRIPKRVLEWKPTGRRNRGRPRKRWIEDIEEDVQIFKWFIHVVCDYNIKYQNDIRWVSQNTTLYYGVRCQKIDMFRPFSIRPSSGLTW